MAYGLRIKNSDFGDGSLEIRAFMMQAVCLNGLVTERTMREIHLGSRLPDNLEVSRKTYELDTATQASLAYDTAKSLLSPASIDAKAKEIQAASAKEIDIEKEIVQLAKKGLILKSRRLKSKRCLWKTNRKMALQVAQACGRWHKLSELWQGIKTKEGCESFKNWEEASSQANS